MPPHVSSICYNTSELTTDVRDKLQELRDALGRDLLEEAWFFADDFSLLRWLYGWDFKFEEIIPRFKMAVERLVALKIPHTSAETLDEFNQLILNMTPCAQYFPGGLMSFDRDGHPVFMQCISKVHPKTLVKCDRVSELFKLILTEAFLAYNFTRKHEVKTGRKLGVKIIIDMDGFNKDLLYAPTMKIYMNLLMLMQDTFPDFARNMYVINAPMMISAIFGMVKPVLAKQTQDKIVFLPKDYKKQLCDELGAENVYERWGGTLKAPGDSDTGFLRVGGIAPEHLRYDPTKNPHHIEEKHMIKVNVPAGKTKDFKITVTEPGSKLHWFFLASNDIDFYIKHENGKHVYPRLRLLTDFVPEFGQVICDHPGSYTLIFDNSYGTFFSKDVKFNVFVKTDDN
uniref:CRAL-TRIO domain-containing protein n=1 Tax=Panagrellus redivivus TaxID=6233 RepID=A0A7E4V8Y6_PANRE